MADGLDVSEMMKRAVQANAKFYKGWMDLTLEYMRGLSAIVGGEPDTGQSIGEMDASSNALVLEGAAGASARGAFLVTNDLGRQLSCEFVSSAFNDASGARIDVKPVFDPSRVELGPGEQRVIQVAVTIDPKLSAGVGYAGEFSIKGMDGFAVPVVLRRAHAVDEPTIRTDPTTRTDPVKEGVSPSPSKKASSRKARAKS